MKIKRLNSFRESINTINDNYTSLGYRYKGNILKNVLSPELFANPLNDIPLRQIERLIEFLVDQVKRIKIVYAIALDKNSTNFN